MRLASRSLLLLVALAIASIDQLSKYYVTKFLKDDRLEVILLPFFKLHYIENTGAAFGMFADHGEISRYALVSISVIFSLVLSWLILFSKLTSKIEAWGFALVLGGALGNLVDRFSTGRVVDFLIFHVGNYSWPAFNVADSTITVGVILLIWQTLVAKKKV